MNDASGRYVQYMRLDELRPAARNAKAHDGPGMQSAMREYGFLEHAILDERTEQLISGHGRREQLLAMMQEQDAPPEGIRIDDDGMWCMPVDRGWASRDDLHAEGAALAINRIGQGLWNDNVLLAALSDQAEYGAMHATGFTADDMDSLLRGSNLLVNAATELFSSALSSPRDESDDEDDERDDGHATVGRTAQPGFGQDRDASTVVDHGWVPVSFTVRPDERVEIRSAVLAAQQRWNTENSAQAMLHICRDFLQRSAA